MGRNSNLSKAKIAKNDEFYTQLSDVNNELKHYKAQFKNKTILCNCDDPSSRNGGKGSNFHTYFIQNFQHLGLNKLITTHYVEDGASYKNIVTKADFDNSGFGLTDDVLLNGNGDFRSDECIELLKEADIVVTNPPFSLFREYMAQLIEYNKDFLIIGSMNAAQVKSIFPLIMENKVWYGVTGPKKFDQPDGTIKQFGNISWYTNLEHKKRNEELILYKTYNAVDYPKYDFYDAISINKVAEIPVDYNGIMGVPFSFLSKYNPNQFEIVDGLNRHNILNGPTPETKGKFQTQVNGDKKFPRLIIKKK